ISSKSTRASIDTIGYTYERRPLLQLIFTSPENQAQLEDLRKQHLLISDASVSQDLNVRTMPVVINLGYTVHGNEASGVNASLLMAYYLASAQGSEIEEMLTSTIIIVDPCLNPDGMNRFAHWVNSHRSTKVINASPDSREHNESWPRARTNHYWFDLNRDWLPVQHPESQARIDRFHQWKPNFLTDHHEMGSNSTFFFQPGIPSRNNPLSPAKAFELTEKLARYHAQYLDEIGSLYYSQESFDDFYYGKGSTYPDVNGSVGILFEQASSRGHLQSTVNGELSFPFTIRNQFVTSLSTIQGCFELREEFLNYQREFFVSAGEEAKRYARKGFIFEFGADKTRSAAFIEMLMRHQIRVAPTQAALLIEGRRYPKGESYYVPLAQPQHRLIRAMFETPTTFTDSLFYDVSAWTLPLAFGLQYDPLGASQLSKVQGRVVPYLAEAPQVTGQVIGGESQYAYAFEWQGYHAPRALNRVFEAGLRAKVATREFVAGDQDHRFSLGTILVPIQNQALDKQQIYQLMQEIASEDGINVHAMSTGYSQGINLGSPSMRALRQPKALLAVGRSRGGFVNGYEAGEVWHLLDHRQEMDVTLVDLGNMNQVDWSEYNVLILVDGSYGALDANEIRNWVQEGGVIVASKGALAWLNGQGLSSLDFKSASKDTSLENLSYADLSNVRGSQVIGGAICQATLDLTHPLGYGFTQETIAVFRNSTRFLVGQDDAYAMPLKYTDQPLLSGYISEENLAALKNSGAIHVNRVGRGRVITLVDNPNFRAFWWGTNKLFLNAIFFGHLI
ncbi:MAG: M14 family zinc carboxypeptidase, partial [Bacteroidota bacterium]